MVVGIKCYPQREKQRESSEDQTDTKAPHDLRRWCSAMTLASNKKKIIKRFWWKKPESKENKNSPPPSTKGTKWDMNVTLYLVRQTGNINRNVGKSPKQRKLPLFYTNHRVNVCKDSLLIKFVNRLLGPLCKTNKKACRHVEQGCSWMSGMIFGCMTIVKHILFFFLVLPHIVNTFLSCKFWLKGREVQSLWQITV